MTRRIVFVHEKLFRELTRLVVMIADLDTTPHVSLHPGTRIQAHKILKNIWIIIASFSLTPTQIISQIEHKISTWSFIVWASSIHDPATILPVMATQLSIFWSPSNDSICLTNFQTGPLRATQFDSVRYQFYRYYTRYYRSGWGMKIMWPSGSIGPWDEIMPIFLANESLKDFALFCLGAVKRHTLNWKCLFYSINCQLRWRAVKSR